MMLPYLLMNFWSIFCLFLDGRCEADDDDVVCLFPIPAAGQKKFETKRDRKDRDLSFNYFYHTDTFEFCRRPGILIGWRGYRAPKDHSCRARN